MNTCQRCGYEWTQRGLLVPKCCPSCKQYTWQFKASPQRQWAISNPEKKQAQADVHAAIKAGKLVRPSICERCRKQTYAVAHHPDYSQPLKVEWICDSCHRKHHSKKKGSSK